MEKPRPQQTFRQIHETAVAASELWVDYRDRSARCGDRDAQLLEKRDRVMEHFCKPGGLLDQYVFASAVESIGAESVVA